MSDPVIVTRTQPGADETAAGLTALGYRPVVSPMLRIVETGLDPHILDGIHEIIFTSANGVRAFRTAGVRADGITAWCVGPSTAAAAEAEGFADVIEGEGDAADLARLILASQARLNGPLLHIANSAAAGQLVSTLRIGGLEARFAAPYHTEPSPALTDEAMAVLAAGRCAVLLHSAKGAEALAHVHPPLGAAFLVAISAAALQPLSHEACAGREIAERPNEAALMQALQRCLPLRPRA